MSEGERTDYVSRAGGKLASALQSFRLDVRGLICADLGSHIGGFVDCLLSFGVARVYSVDTSYGTLAWKLRRDPRVVVHERTNAMHVILPEPVDLVTIDVGWTPQRKVLPAAQGLIKPEGRVVTLVKPHYEAPREWLVGGVLPDERLSAVEHMVRDEVTSAGWSIVASAASPFRGHGGNLELFLLLAR